MKMNEDIKEILENYVNHNEIELILNELREIVDEEIVDYGAELSLSECKCLLNYITNLQEENKKLKEVNEEHRKINGDLRKENQKLVKVIDELENYLKEESKYDEYKDVFYREHMGYVLNKLTKLKGDKDVEN